MTQLASPGMAPATADPDAASTGRKAVGLRWSVCLPTYNPGEHHLAHALESVLCQDPGPGAMEIVVVDDASPKVDTAALVRRLAGDRVRCEVQTVNRRIAGNMNRCLELAGGEWVHILHQDDCVRPGFYGAIGELGARFPDLLAAFTRHAYVDDAGKETYISDLEQDEAGPLPNFIDRIFCQQRLQVPSMAVRRTAYQKVGPFRTDLRFSLDWDMWMRLAAAGPVGFVPEVLAEFRIHGGSESSRLELDDRCFDERIKVMKDARKYLPASRIGRALREGRRRALAAQFRAAWVCMKQGQPKAARRKAIKLLRHGQINRDTLKLLACAIRGH